MDQGQTAPRYRPDLDLGPRLSIPGESRSRATQTKYRGQRSRKSRRETATRRRRRPTELHVTPADFHRRQFQNGKKLPRALLDSNKCPWPHFLAHPVDSKCLGQFFHVFSLNATFVYRKQTARDRGPRSGRPLLLFLYSYPDANSSPDL